MIDILLFANLREKVGKEKLSLNIAGITVEEMKQSHLPKHGLDNLSDVMIAINEEYSKDEYVLQQGDVVALIPPVSGG